MSKIQSTRRGYIYLMRNPAISYTKIGFTYKHPRDRARELSSVTGVPDRYSVTYWWRVPRPEYYERQIFIKLRNYRVSKEFFDISSWEESVRLVSEVFEELGETDIVTLDDEQYSDPTNYRKLIEQYNWLVELGAEPRSPKREKGIRSFVPNAWFQRKD